MGYALKKIHKLMEFPAEADDPAYLATGSFPAQTRLKNRQKRGIPANFLDRPQSQFIRDFGFPHSGLGVLSEKIGGPRTLLFFLWVQILVTDAWNRPSICRPLVTFG